MDNSSSTPADVDDFSEDQQEISRNSRTNKSDNVDLRLTRPINPDLEAFDDEDKIVACASSFAAMIHHRALPGDMFRLTLDLPMNAAPLWLLRKKPGTALAVAIVELDQESFVAKTRGLERNASMVTRAAMLTQEPLFQYWFARNYDDADRRIAIQYEQITDSPILSIDTIQSFNKADNKLMDLACASMLRKTIGVTSRADIKTSNNAADLIRKIGAEFDGWKKRYQGQHRLRDQA
jgi:hypothetical protein